MHRREMAAVHPMAIQGPWRAGFVLDYHTIDSTYVGDDQYGHPVFDTKRTELGELLYRLKYGLDNLVAGEMVEALAGFVEISWKPTLTMVIPMPPSDSGRTQQPVFILADALGKRLGLPVQPDAVNKARKTPQLKNVYDYQERMRFLDGSFSADPSLVAGHRVLLLDDLYRSGATMSSVTRVLYEQGKAADVYALALTRTRRKS